MDGTQLAEAMRRTRELAEIPIVAVTADVDVGSTYDMSLFAKIIAKPVTADKLRALFGEIGQE
jgi:CheY-like chemotaxis protein